MSGNKSRRKGANGMEASMGDNETWAEIPLPELNGRYQVSSTGRIRAHPCASIKGMKPGRVLGCTGQDESGYPQYSFAIGNSLRKTVKIHRLVALAFLGERQDGQQVNHIDGDKSNNALENLEYVSALENARHARVVVLGGGVEINGETLALPEAVEKYGARGVTAKAVRRRVNRYGWPMTRAILTPIQPTGRPTEAWRKSCQ